MILVFQVLGKGQIIMSRIINCYTSMGDWVVGLYTMYNALLYS